MEQLCRTCHSEITSDDCIALNDNYVNSARVKSQLLLCVPELQQDLVKDPVLCATCVSALHVGYAFKVKCSETEERIWNYFRNTKLIEKSVTFVELYEQDAKVKSSALCNSLDVNGIVLKTSNVTGIDSDKDADTEGVIGLATNRDIINSDDVENGVIVKDEYDLTQFKVEENVEDDYLTSNNELEKLSVLQLLDESLQITQNQFKNSEECSVKFAGFEDLPQSQRGKILKATFSSTKSENQCVTIEAAESADDGKEEEYLKKKNLVFNVITNSNSKDGLRETQASNIRSKELLTNECFVKLVRIDDILRLQSENVLNTIVSPSRHENQSERTDTESSINGKEQEGLLTEIAASSVIIGNGEKPYGCTVCEFRTSLQKSFIQHMRTHKEEKPFRCTICEFCTAQRHHLKRHMNIHTGEKPFLCTICEFRSSRQDDLKRHMKIHTDEKPFQCSICEFRTARQHRLKSHMKNHTGEKPFLCTICEFCTARRYHLQRHMKIHTEEKPFRCSICEFRTARQYQLKSHMKTHTGEKPFLCTICEFCTARRYHLQRHMKTHTGEKPFRCSICKFCTARQGNLKTHMRTHTREKPFQCNICEIRTTQRGHLKTHMRTHTGE